MVKWTCVGLSNSLFGFMAPNHSVDRFKTLLGSSSVCIG